MAKCGTAVQEVGRAIQRVDEPPVLAVLTADRTRLLQEKTEAGSRAGELPAQNLLGAPVGGADEVARPLDRDLKVLDLAEIAHQRPRRLVHGLDHHGDVRGTECHGVWS